MSYTDATGATTTTTYDRFGYVAATTQLIDTQVIDDGSQDGVTTTVAYTYDDPRGYVTSFTDSVAGTIDATWGPDGQLTTEHLPGGITLTIASAASSTPEPRRPCTADFAARGPRVGDRADDAAAGDAT